MLVKEVCNGDRCIDLANRVEYGGPLGPVAHELFRGVCVERKPQKKTSVQEDDEAAKQNDLAQGVHHRQSAHVRGKLLKSGGFACDLL